MIEEVESKKRCIPTKERALNVRSKVLKAALTRGPYLKERT